MIVIELLVWLALMLGINDGPDPSRTNTDTSPASHCFIEDWDCPNDLVPVD